MTAPLKTVPEFKALEEHFVKAKTWHMRELFEKDSKRFDKFRCVTRSDLLARQSPRAVEVFLHGNAVSPLGHVP